MIDIFVGAEQSRFHLHLDLLCDRSDYFKACIKGNFKEAQQKELFLPEDDIESFDLFVRWLYGATLKKISSKDDLPVYLALSILANKLCLEHLQNETMDHILIFYRLSPPETNARTIRFIYGNTYAGYPLLKLLVRCAAWKVVFNEATVFEFDEQSLLRGGGDIAIAFATLQATYYAASKGNRKTIEEIDPRRKSNCDYHEHNITPACSDPSK